MESEFEYIYSCSTVFPREVGIRNFLAHQLIMSEFKIICLCLCLCLRYAGLFILILLSQILVRVLGEKLEYTEYNACIQEYVEIYKD